eukprot:TRINITY_DN66083_c0_g1_i1.p1 TRINITY_DN66083_c0_g1~~TRINITY_DN66083_c0_g1_i1.p1  ORF type:complete len:390 (+),score=71.47 TRINITY_DN66083_c0_g1_i1:73-1242(+)
MASKARAVTPTIAPTSAAVGYLGKCRSVDVFEKLNRLGEGTYGTVYRARDAETEKIVALKKVRIHSEKDGFPKCALREIRLLKRLKHPNVVDFYEVVCGKQPTSIFLVFEYCEHDVGALLDLMERSFGHAEVKCLLLQLLKAVEHLHAQFIIHRDIKLSNLLLTNGGVLKLADFGLAREFMEPPEPCTTNIVTLWYRSPELLLGAPVYSTAVDVWSIGCNFGELLDKKPLLPGKSEVNQLQLICELLGTPSPKIWPGLTDLPLFKRLVSLPPCDYNNLRVKFPDAPDSCLELLNRMLTFNPSKRITAASCMQHRYFFDAPAPQEPRFMPTFKEHRNFTTNPRAPGNASLNVGNADAQLFAGAGKRPPAAALAPRSALFAAAKKIRTSVF